MNGNKVLLDSNIVIYLSQGELKSSQVIIPDFNYYISIITYMEVLGYSPMADDEKEFIDEYVSSFDIIPVQRPIADKVIEIRQQKRMKLPDAIIAATALINDCALLTRNISDFSNIKDLILKNPF